MLNQSGLRSFLAGGILLIGISPQRVGAQIILGDHKPTGEHERPLLMGARAAAIADAYVADITDVTLLHGNPGALSFLEKSAVVIDHFHESSTGVMNDMIAVPFQLGSMGSLALGMGASHVGYITTGNPNIGQVIQYNMDLGYAMVVSPSFSAGVRVGARYGRSEKSELMTNTWTIGLSYYPSTEISYGLVYGEIGEGMRFASSELVRETLPRRLQIGMIMRYPSSRTHRLLTLSLANEKIIDQVGLLYKMGIEIIPVRILALRFGYVVGSLTSGARYGAGINIGSFQLDYVTSPSVKSIRFQQLTLSIDIE